MAPRLKNPLQAKKNGNGSKRTASLSARPGSGGGVAAGAVAKVAAAASVQMRALSVRKDRGELKAERRRLAALQKKARVALRAADTARRQLVSTQRTFKVAAAKLVKLRKEQRSTFRATATVATWRSRMQAAERKRADTLKVAHAARRSRKAQEAVVASRVLRQEKSKKRMKVQLLLLRQERVRQAACARLQQRHRSLEKRQHDELKALRARQAEALRSLEERQLEARTALHHRASEQTRSMREQHREAARSYEKWLHSDESRHADKFQRCEGGSLGNSMCILRPRNAKHQCTLVYLHQFNCQGFGYAHWKPHYFYSATKFPFNGLKIVLPTARSIPITAHDDEEKHAWYDYLTDFDGVREDKVNMKTLRATRDRIFSILQREIELLDGDASRVFLGGASQGCCVALHCALQYPRLLGGVVGIVGHLLSCTPVPASKRNLPISLYNGLDDRVMRWSWVRKTFRRLEAAGCDQLRMHRAPGVGHDTGIKEREWMVEFLSRHIGTRE